MITNLSTAVKDLNIEMYIEHKDKIDLFEVSIEMLDLFVEAYIDKNPSSYWIRARVFNMRNNRNILININFFLNRYVVDCYDRFIYNDFSECLDYVNEILVEY